MKISKNTIKITKLVKLYFIKTKIYQKKQIDEIFHVKDIESNLKKIHKILHNYVYFNKKILFISDSLYIENKIKNILNNNHIFIFQKFWSNENINNLKIKKDKTYLIVFISKNLNTNLVNQVIKSRIPFIIFSNSKLNFNYNRSYSTPGYFFDIKNQQGLEFILTEIKQITNRN